MERKKFFLISKLFLSFQNWTFLEFKNVQKLKAWIFYGKSITCDHILKLR